MSFGLLRSIPLLLRIIFSNSDSLVFKEIMNSFPCVFDIAVVFEMIIVIHFLLCFIKVDQLFLFVFYS